MNHPRVEFRTRLIPAGYEELSVGAAAIGLASLPEGAVAGLVRYQNGPIRARWDGTDPTAAVGQPWFDNDLDLLNRAEMLKLKAIRTGVTNGLLAIHYYKPA